MKNDIAITDPLALIQQCRTSAREASDANADISFLALASADGKASVRTLVLRDIDSTSLSLFINETSPKWQLLEAGCHYELLLWYPSLQRQFRVQGQSVALDKSIVASNWQNKPQASKRLDFVYGSGIPQSSTIPSRNYLIQKIETVAASTEIEGETQLAPDNASGVRLIADEIEMLDLNSSDRIHLRERYTLKNGVWQTQTLMP